MRRFLIALTRLVGYFAAVFAATVIALIPMRVILGDLESLGPRLELFVTGTSFLFGVVIVNAGMSRVLKSRLVKSGWPDRRVGARWFGIGVLIGLGMAGGMLALTWASGGGQLTIGNGGFSKYLLYVLPLVGSLLIAALCEEWIFRGYPLAVLPPVIGRGWANVLVALVFTAAHWGGSGWSSLAAMNILLFSLVNGAIRFSPGGIPAAWGFHFSWNSLQVLSGAILTGDDVGVPVVRFSGQGPRWLSGGAFGPEGSVATTAATIIGLVLIWSFLRHAENRSCSV